MELNEIREVYQRLRRRQQGIGPTIDREIGLAQVELLAEIAAQLSVANGHLARIGLLNFEKIGLQLEIVLKEYQERSHHGS